MLIWNIIAIVDRWPPPEATPARGTGTDPQQGRSHTKKAAHPLIELGAIATDPPGWPPPPPPAPGGCRSSRRGGSSETACYRQSQERTEPTEKRSTETWSRRSEATSASRPGVARAKQTEHLGAKRQHGTLNRNVEDFSVSRFELPRNRSLKIDCQRRTAAEPDHLGGTTCKTEAPPWGCGAGHGRREDRRNKTPGENRLSLANQKPTAPRANAAALLQLSAQEPQP